MDYLKSVFTIKNIIHFLFVDVTSFFLAILLMIISLHALLPSLLPFEVVPRTDEIAPDTKRTKNMTFNDIKGKTVTVVLRSGIQFENMTLEDEGNGLISYKTEDGDIFLVKREEIAGLIYSPQVADELQKSQSNG